MKNDHTYELLVAKMQEVTMLPPQTVGPFTPAYKRLVPYVKSSPWKAAMFCSIAGTALIYLLFGARLVRLVSILQFGF